MFEDQTSRPFVVRYGVHETVQVMAICVKNRGCPWLDKLVSCTHTGERHIVAFDPASVTGRALRKLTSRGSNAAKNRMSRVLSISRLRWAPAFPRHIEGKGLRRSRQVKVKVQITIRFCNQSGYGWDCPRDHKSQVAFAGDLNRCTSLSIHSAPTDKKKLEWSIDWCPIENQKDRGIPAHLGAQDRHRTCLHGPYRCRSNAWRAQSSFHKSCLLLGEGGGNKEATEKWADRKSKTGRHMHHL